MKSLSSAFALAVCIALPGGAQEPAKPAPWTYEEARELLEISPRDPYAQYLAVLLAKKAGREQEVFQLLDRSAQGDARFGRARQVDLFNLFSGALAVQESLQLDTLRGGGGAPRGRGFDQAPFDDRAAPTEPKAADPNARPLDQPAIKSERVDDPKEEAKVAVPDGEIRESVKQPAGRANQPPRRGRKSPDAARDADKVAISSLVGPTIKSHPWKEMLAGKKPEIEPMAMCVPADNYYVAFRSIGKMLELEDSADLWGIQILSQTARDATTQNVGQRLKAQLAIETTPLLRPFYDLVVESVAITGSDLYVREGSDVTLIFRLRTPDVFRARMDGFLDSAAKANPTARRTDSAYGGVAYRGLVSADRRVSVYSAYPSANLHVRSNSLVGLQRALAAIRGQDPAGKRVTRLGETEEFAYIRTLMPKGAPEEDGFIYLSDPFIRNVVGPAQKLAERRRMICFNHLKMAGHGVAMHRAQTGANPGSFQQLVASGSAPGEYGKGPWSCPDGG
ncbi:MAG TPA: hypothetical protein VNC50_15000, partial [Planctomycetia bacterium]|nr:hypothetical protein [Planctomycetia bacterium]